MTNPPGTVGVLLPLYLETRFTPGLLRLRVVPDAPWSARHDPLVSAGEVAALDRYLLSVREPDLQEQAWRELVGHVGGARAVYLVRTLVVLDDGTPVLRPIDPDELREEPAFPRILGFPAELHVWLARAGGPPSRVLTLPIDETRLRTDFPDPDVPGEHRWWEDWEEARLAGLAAEIPLDGDPSDIDALYVTGLGAGEPADLFGSHRDEGRLGLLAPGTPTNTVDGASAAPLGRDPATWWEVLQSPAGESDRAVSAALTGDPDLLGRLPGSTEPHQRMTAAVVAALWPALWGFAGQDVWALKGTADAATWALRALAPEGPFPTVRIGDQPYGLLPTTAFDQWRPRPGDPPVEAAMMRALVNLRDVYASAAEGRGTAVGASTETLLDLLGQLPTSPVFRQRTALPLELWWPLLLFPGFPVGWADLDAAWSGTHPLAGEWGLRPARRYGTVGAPRRIDLPLIRPEDWPENLDVPTALHRIVDLAQQFPRAFIDTRLLALEWLQHSLDSLLLKLVVRSVQVALGDVGRAQIGEQPPGPEPLATGDGAATRLANWIVQATPASLHDATEEALRFQRMIDGVRAIAEIPPERLERLLRATVDTAAFRVDPWLTGVPTRRLQDLLDTGSATFRLGTYGWVDRPRPGTPGPTPAGLLHAPSPAQAITATVLRDRAVNDPSPRWNLDLTSRAVRDADRLTENVRVGAHLAEALGREVELAVGVPADITRLRAAYPIRTEHAGRRVCDGLAVLAAPPADLGLDDDRLEALDHLRTILDAYGDLLVAEAVHHVTEGRAEVAGAVMDAAAGLSRPPHLGMLRTPREGRAVTTSIVIALPALEPPPDPATNLERAELSPTVIADPAAAAFVREQVGDADEWTFEVGEVDGGPSGASTTVTLADIAVGPADALALTRTDLDRLAADAGADTLGLPPSAVVVTGGTAPSRYEAAARLVAMVGRLPAGPDAVAEQADAAADQTAVDTDLTSRYTRVRTTAALLADQLSTEVAKTTDGTIGTADPALLGRLVRAARAWGVAPDPPPAADPQATPDHPLIAAASRAAELLNARVAAAPPVAGPRRDDVVAALAALVSPTGQTAITATLTRRDLPGLHQDGSLDEAWLPTMGTVRESVARIDAHRLAAGGAVGAGAPLRPWTNKPADPWQKDAADGRRMVVVYAAAGLDLEALPVSSAVAVAAVDRFAEVVPAPEQTTGAAFGFDAPAARPPQSILLAVPPDPSTPMDEETLVAVVAGTRRLARARVARPVDLPTEVHGMLPTALLPATGSTAVSLDPQ